MELELELSVLFVALLRALDDASPSLASLADLDLLEEAEALEREPGEECECESFMPF